MTQSIYDFRTVSLSGDKINMKDFEGKVKLIVNVESKCGLTYTY
jgi:glutathione peroxidase-family protein